VEHEQSVVSVPSERFEVSEQRQERRCTDDRDRSAMRSLVALILACAGALGAVTPAIRPYPRQYGVHELRPGQAIHIDGNLSEPAWLETPWSEPFVDIASGPTPRFLTKYKARWQGENLYVGYYLEDTQIWANQTVDDTVVFYDNDAEVFIDPDDESTPESAA